MAARALHNILTAGSDRDHYNHIYHLGYCQDLDHVDTLDSTLPGWFHP